MEPALFGDPPLFGLFHPAAAGSARGHGVLICPPIAYEHIRAHRALRNLAVQLSRAGFDALRFDYFGVGDSSGTSEEARVARWHGDVATAADELRSLAGAMAISVIGVRLGATLAASAAQLQTDHLILWDPIVDGRAWVQRLERMHQALLGDLKYFQRPRRESPNDGLLGFAFTPDLRSDLAQLDLQHLTRWSARKITIVTGTSSDDEQKVVEALQARGLCGRLCSVGQALDWEDLSSPDVAVSGAQATEAAVQSLLREEP